MEKVAARPIMIQGTASGVGKTILVMALCRIFREDGYKVAPFKSQNMTRNTALTKGGDEIAVSQLLQAKAAGIEPETRMNPIVLKPSPEHKETEIILNGHYYGKVSAVNYGEIKDALTVEVMKAYTGLSEHFEIMVVEGAGGPVELNLKDDDMVNMGIARRLNAPVLLVADVDRGGVFASLYGTIGLLGESDRKYVKAVIVNRFKGDLSYFGDGVKILEQITGLPVAGVVPYIHFSMPEEDGLFNTSDVKYAGGDFDSQFDLIADNVRRALDMELVYKILNTGVEE